MAPKFYPIIAGFLVLAGCVKDKPTELQSVLTQHGTLVICEGQFSAGNASLYRIDVNTGSSQGDLYKQSNGTYAGDVLQSMYRIGANYWLLLNNSGKISVVDTQNFKVQHTIPVKYPRYLLQVDDQTVWISTLYSKKVMVVDINSAQVIDSIILPDNNPEGMCLMGNSVFIATWDTASNAVWKVDVSSHSVQRINISSIAPHDILLDYEQKLWVLSGNATKGRAAAFTRIDPSTGIVLASYKFQNGIEPIKPVLTKRRDSVYFIEVNFNGGTTANGIYRAALNNFSIPSVPFIQAVQYQYFWALGINPDNCNVFVGDPKGFNQAGSVYEYSTTGTQLRSYKVGVGPGGFLFN